MAATVSTIDRRLAGGYLCLGILVALEAVTYILGLIWPSLRQAVMPEWLPGGEIIARYGIFSLIGYSFVHAGPMHLLFNLLFLIFTGRIFLMISGTRQFAAALTAGIFIGALGFIGACLLLRPAHEMALCGLSGGVLGVSGALWSLADEIPSGARLSIPGIPVLKVFLPSWNLRLSPMRLRILAASVILFSIMAGLSGPAIATHLAALAAGRCLGFVLHNQPAVAKVSRQ